MYLKLNFLKSTAKKSLKKCSHNAVANNKRLLIRYACTSHRAQPLLDQTQQEMFYAFSALQSEESSYVRYCETLVFTKQGN